MKFHYCIFGVAFSIFSLTSKVNGQIYEWNRQCYAYPCGPKDYLDFCTLQKWCFCLGKSTDPLTGHVDYDKWSKKEI
ncbi:UNVERIFIED_CONTAM: hypothetical protein RMT77_001005 [Armadillidium vulgare]